MNGPLGTLGVVLVDLTGTLCRNDDELVLRVNAVQKFVDGGLDNSLVVLTG